MSESMFSGSWYRVAGIRPRLRSHAQIHRHVYRGQVWYVLQDHSSGRFHRFSAVANLVIGLMDGRRTLQEIWHTACTRLGDDAPTQDEVIGLIASLHKADVLQTDAPPDIQELHERKQEQDRQKLKQYIQNPLSLRFPLFDPERLLERMAGISRVLFSWQAGLVWLVIVGWALVQVGIHWAQLSKDVTDQVFSAENLLLIALIFPIAKLLHEFGHALAVKAAGGEVHEMGIMLLVMMPIPYVDASAASGFRDKRTRMLVGASGMLIEVFVAALAMFVWLAVEPGVVRAVAYNVMSGISAVVFNGNPLLRFDAYYILSDYLEIPNLGQRANAYLGYLVNRYVFGMKWATVPEATAGEGAWFVFYSIASFIYRIFIAITIALLVSAKFFFIGVLLAIWSLYLMVFQPLFKTTGWLFSADQLATRRTRALSITGAVVAALAVVVLWVPAPSWTLTEGVAWAPEDAVVRAGSDGFVTEIVAPVNSRVTRGTPLVITSDPDLGSQVEVLSAQLAEQQARYSAAVVQDQVYAAIVQEEMVHIRERLAVAQRRIQDLVIRSPGDGVFIMENPQDLPGRYVNRGQRLGYVMDFSKVAVRVVIPQAEVDLVREMTRRVELRSVERIPEKLSATVIRAAPAATDELPSLALSLQGGGGISVDPGSVTDENSRGRANTTLFHFDLQLQAEAGRINTLGSRLYARFEREPEPLGTQWYRVIRRTLLKQFNV